MKQLSLVLVLSFFSFNSTFAQKTVEEFAEQFVESLAEDNQEALKQLLGGEVNLLDFYQMEEDTFQKDFEPEYSRVDIKLKTILLNAKRSNFDLSKTFIKNIETEDTQDEFSRNGDILTKLNLTITDGTQEALIIFQDLMQTNERIKAGNMIDCQFENPQAVIDRLDKFKVDFAKALTTQNRAALNDFYPNFKEIKAFFEKENLPMGDEFSYDEMKINFEKQVEKYQEKLDNLFERASERNFDWSTAKLVGGEIAHTELEAIPDPAFDDITFAMHNYVMLFKSKDHKLTLGVRWVEINGELFLDAITDRSFE